MFYGFDMDRIMFRIGVMNMMLYGVDNFNIEYKDFLLEVNIDKDKFILVLVNFFFKGSLDYEVVLVDLLKVIKIKKIELLFLVFFLRVLKIGGRCVCIVLDGVLFGLIGGYKLIRKEIVDNYKLEVIILMLSGVFKFYVGVFIVIMIFIKIGIGGIDKVWFYDMKVDGYFLDDKRNEIKDSDIEDIIKRFDNFDGEVDRKRIE